MTTSTETVPTPDSIQSVSTYVPAVAPPRSAKSWIVAFEWGARVPDAGLADSQAADSTAVHASESPPPFETVTEAEPPVEPKSTCVGATASRAGDATATASATERWPPFDPSVSVAAWDPSESADRSGVTTTVVVEPGAVVPDPGSTVAQDGPSHDHVSGASPALVTYTAAERSSTVSASEAGDTSASGRAGVGTSTVTSTSGPSSPTRNRTRPEWTPGSRSSRSTSIRTTADPPPVSVP